jgi:hypothetical protein
VGRLESENSLERKLSWTAQQQWCRKKILSFPLGDAKTAQLMERLERLLREAAEVEIDEKLVGLTEIAAAQPSDTESEN